MIYVNEESGTRYERVKLVGKGSFGDAELVIDIASQKHYILKRIELELLTPKERRSAINEVKLLATLKHPYIINYKESILQEGALCIIMDYAEGGDLSAAIKNNRRNKEFFDHDFVLKVFTQLVLALKYMHSKYILHRDIKSSNIFLCGDRVCIGDFGISRLLRDTGAFAKTSIGTPFYLSPEICRNDEYNWTSDIWSLGCILYEMLTNEVPFQSGNLAVLMEKITRADYAPLPETIPADFRHLVTFCLDPDSTSRPGAKELLAQPCIQATIQSLLDKKLKVQNKNDLNMPFEKKDINPVLEGSTKMSLTNEL